MDTEIKALSVFFIIILIMIFVSKSGKQFITMLFGFLFIVGSLGIIRVNGLTIESIMGIGAVGLTVLLGWFVSIRKFAYLLTSRNLVYSKLAQKMLSNCNVCGQELSYHRMPKNLNQLFFGGLTCKNCGAEFDIPFNKFMPK
ncbi:MAG: hypothetical protein OT477_21965 [Chloroflexi bacterium]|nr:hypothetical protein [Chloroflexota bacterium]